MGGIDWRGMGSTIVVFPDQPGPGRLLENGPNTDGFLSPRTVRSQRHSSGAAITCWWTVVHVWPRRYASGFGVGIQGHCGVSGRRSRVFSGLTAHSVTGECVA